MSIELLLFFHFLLILTDQLIELALDLSYFIKNFSLILLTEQFLGRIESLCGWSRINVFSFVILNEISC